MILVSFIKWVNFSLLYSSHFSPRCSFSWIVFVTICYIRLLWNCLIYITAYSCYSVVYYEFLLWHKKCHFVLLLIDSHLQVSQSKPCPDHLMNNFLRLSLKISVDVVLVALIVQLLEMVTVTQVQIPDEAVFISYSTTTPEKSMNPTFLIDSKRK